MLKKGNKVSKANIETALVPSQTTTTTSSSVTRVEPIIEPNELENIEKTPTEHVPSEDEDDYNEVINDSMYTEMEKKYESLLRIQSSQMEQMTSEFRELKALMMSNSEKAHIEQDPLRVPLVEKIHTQQPRKNFIPDLKFQTPVRILRTPSKNPSYPIVVVSEEESSAFESEELNKLKSYPKEKTNLKAMTDLDIVVYKKGDNFRKWLLKFEVLADRGSWGNKQKILNFHHYMDKEIQQWCFEIEASSGGEMKSYDKLTQVIFQAFDPSFETSTDKIQKALSMRMRENTNSAIWYAELVEAFREAEIEDKHMWFRDTWLQGLNPIGFYKAVQSKVSIKQDIKGFHLTQSELLKVAQEVEAENHQFQKKKEEMNKSKESKPNNTTSNDNKPKPIHNHPTINNKLHTHNKPHTPNKPHIHTHVTSEKKEWKECGYCGEKHDFRECKEKFSGYFPSEIRILKKIKAQIHTRDPAKTYKQITWETPFVVTKAKELSIPIYPKKNNQSKVPGDSSKSASPLSLGNLKNNPKPNNKPNKGTSTTPNLKGEGESS
jgi:hypothetical protein